MLFSCIIYQFDFKVKKRESLDSLEDQVVVTPTGSGLGGGALNFLVFGL
jgi:hypothetical protein